MNKKVALALVLIFFITGVKLLNDSTSRVTSCDFGPCDWENIYITACWGFTLVLLGLLFGIGQLHSSIKKKKHMGKIPVNKDQIK